VEIARILLLKELLLGHAIQLRIRLRYHQHLLHKLHQMLLERLGGEQALNVLLVCIDVLDQLILARDPVVFSALDV